VKGSQFLAPLFEFSGACSGCGETPYIKLMTQLFGDRAVIANATGCSSIYGGNLPTTPYCTNAQGRGPAWSNSLFEDNAEFGLGMRLALDQHADHAQRLVRELAGTIGEDLAGALLTAEMGDEAGIALQRERVELLRQRLGTDEKARRLAGLADYLVKKSLWIVGGDGWAYDIGYGGLDHVLASGHDVNVLVLDTEVYSNTGGQASKATPLGAVAKFAAEGKARPKKDLGLLAMMYGDIFVAQVALGAKDAQTYKAFVDAESWGGPSLIIAYSPCIAHGYDLRHMVDHQKLAVDTGYWPLFSFDPRRVEAGQPGLKLDTKKTKAKVSRYMETEGRFRMLAHTQPERAAALTRRAQEVIDARLASLLELANTHKGER
jgi:pyruvate-ferredoxin/flavodoxin oxidoreductase